MSDSFAVRSKAGKARMDRLTPDQRKELARSGAAERWRRARETRMQASDVLDADEVIPVGPLPDAKYKGALSLVGIEIPCYVLDNGQRVIGRTSATEMLTGIKGGGGLEKYLGVEALKPFIDIGLVLEKMVPFRLAEVQGLERHVKGLPADLLIDICRGFVDALQASNDPTSDTKLTPRQAEMAIKASMFLASCAKVGLDALIDEATGHQYDRAQDALQVKLKAYLSDELRKWEKTFPDDLWLEFGRLTNWKGSVTQRPKYWGYLVTELVYDYLDRDVAQWLQENHPQPRDEKWHQWLTKHYGVQKLLQHIYILIGIARTCHSMHELKRKMAEMHNRIPVQYTLFIRPGEEPMP